MGTWTHGPPCRPACNNRSGIIQVGGFNLSEVGRSNGSILWLRGGIPLSFLAPGESASMRWREAFITAFLERDLPQLGIAIPAAITAGPISCLPDPP